MVFGVFLKREGPNILFLFCCGCRWQCVTGSDVASDGGGTIVDGGGAIGATGTVGGGGGGTVRGGGGGTVGGGGGGTVGGRSGGGGSVVVVHLLSVEVNLVSMS